MSEEMGTGNRDNSGILNNSGLTSGQSTKRGNLLSEMCRRLYYQNEGRHGGGTQTVYRLQVIYKHLVSSSHFFRPSLLEEGTGPVCHLPRRVRVRCVACRQFVS